MGTLDTTNYIMEHESEGARIRNKTDLESTRSQLMMAGLERGMHCLDVGCASGAVSVEMARLADPGAVVGLDTSEQRLDQAEALAQEAGVSRILFRRGDAYQIPSEDDTFDFVWNRFLLEYLKDPGAAIREMKRVTKPGGTVVSADLDGNCLFHYPIEPRLERGLEKVMKILSASGFYPFVGRKLYHYYGQVGFSDIRVFMMPHHLIAGVPTENQRQNWYEKIETIRERVTDSSTVSEEMRSIARSFKELIDSPDTFTYITDNCSRHQVAFQAV
ncbi:class I SAM-dependent methyltransferase [Thermodesulfobacteriota bacterium]